MAAITVAVVLTSLVALCACEKNFTVTFEVTLEVEVKNYNGQGDDINGKIVIGMFGDTAPITALNFKNLCNGWTRDDVKLSYKNSFCHRLVKDMLIQCGDITTGDGTGTISIYGPRFNDENFTIKHRSGGIVSMANHGRDTNGSQFFITFGPSRFLDQKHVAFGKVIKGYNILRALNRMGSQPDFSTPKRPIRITECSTAEVKKYELSQKDMEKDDLEETK
ncbi:hypothetical protein BaRGS_00030926 [Batillaria attramentaria]|uniref:Peptidyl-prolyl cis-trans isomerase n=1 Tax=Batillaria attramentaria TaxID=370345 RepID=A0ABD0JRY2_9CAEN